MSGFVLFPVLIWNFAIMCRVRLFSSSLCVFPSFQCFSVPFPLTCPFPASLHLCLIPSLECLYIVFVLPRVFISSFRVLLWCHPVSHQCFWCWFLMFSLIYTLHLFKLFSFYFVFLTFWLVSLVSCILGFMSFSFSLIKLALVSESCFLCALLHLGPQLLPNYRKTPVWNSLECIYMIKDNIQKRRITPQKCLYKSNNALTLCYLFHKQNKVQDKTN